MNQTAKSIMINSVVFENFKNTITYSTKTGKLHSFIYEKVVYMF